MKAQLMYDLTPLEAGPAPAGAPPRIITEAAIAFETRVSTDWPLDAIFGAMAHHYNYPPGDRTTAPEIRVVHESSRVVGYMVQPPGYASSNPHQLFWNILLENNRAERTHGEYRLLNEDGRPTSQAFSVDGWDGDTPIGVVGYIGSPGQIFPAAPVNRALERLIGQADWPSEDLYLWPYLVAKGGSSDASGLWIAPTKDNLNFESTADDDAFRYIRDINSFLAQRRHSHYQMEEFTV